LDGCSNMVICKVSMHSMVFDEHHCELISQVVGFVPRFENPSATFLQGY
jgi:hypothetical protein